MPVKDYLGLENARNKKHAKLYERLIKLAYGDICDVLVGHHLTFEEHGNIDTENEVPAADTLLFDHEIMGRVFGAQAVDIMLRLCAVPADSGQREAIVEDALEARGVHV